MSKLNIIILIAIAVFILITGYLIFGGNKIPSIPNAPQQTNTNTVPGNSNPAPEAPIGGVVYSASGFNPTIIRFKSNQGAKVIFSNTSSSSLTIEADPNGKNVNASAMNVGTIQAGQTKTITLPTAGTYSYRNSTNTSQKGSFEVILP